MSSPTFRRRLLAVLTIFPSLIRCTEGSTCYWPNKSVVQPGQGYYAPCSSLGGPCCRENEACLSNGLCFGATIGLPYRGACTNADWSGCVNLGNAINPSTSSNLWFCGAANKSLEGPWWVGDTDHVAPCETGTWADFIKWPSAVVGKVIERTDPAVSSPGSPAGSSQVATTDSAIVPSIFVVSLVGSRTIVAPASSTSAPVASSTATVTATGEPGQSGNSLAFGLGAGLGVPLGLAAVGFLSFLAWKVRRQKLEKRKSTSTDTPYTEVQTHEQSRHKEVGSMPGGAGKKRDWG